MAYERLSERKIIAANLGSFITSQISLLRQNAVRRNLEDEASFNEQVLADNLTLEQQLTYRNDQLKRIPSGDKDERARVRAEIAGLKNRIGLKDFQDSYVDELTKFNSGIQSIDQTIAWLESRRSSNTNEDIDGKIRDNISALKAKRYEIQQDALTKQTQYATENKTEEVLSAQIKKVDDARVSALNAGNKDYVALLDLQLQGLNKAMTESKINSTLLNISVATMSGGSSTALLNRFNSQLSGADAKTPITVGGVKYDSESAFWNSKRADYLNDRSENGFFSRYNNELTEKVNYKNTKGVLHNDSLGDVKSWYDSLADRPELTDYKERIDQAKIKSMKSTADLRSASIINEYAVKSDAQKAISDLAYIQDAYGIDQSINYQKVVMSAAKEKESQVREILSTMNQLMADSPGLSSQSALTQAIKSGAGANYSAEELATKKASDIITNAGEKSEKEQFGEGGTGTINPKKEGAGFASPQYQEGGLYKMPGDKTTYKYENGKLRAFTGNFTDDMFKAATGKGFNQVEEIKNITGAPTGDPIKAQDYQPKPEERGDYLFAPELLKYYKPEQVITQGTEKYLKAGVKPIWGSRVTGDQFKDMQKQYAPDVLEQKVIRAGKDIYFRQ